MFKIGDKVKNKDNKNFSNAMNELTVAGTCEDGMVSFKEMDNLKHFKCLELVENRSVNMNKIKVSKEVAAALDLGIKVAGKERLLDDHFSCMTWKIKEYQPLNQISNWKMAQILINGYEVVETPEEKVKNLYEKCINSRDAFEFDSKYYISWDSEAKGIVNCLNRLGISIKGINE